MNYKGFINGSLIVSILTLTGCTPAGRSIQLSKDVYQVTCRGNGFNPPEVVQESVLKKCAEVTLNSGNRYFVVLNSSTVDRPSVWTSPGTVNLNTNGDTVASFYGNNMFANQSYNTSGYIIPPRVNRVDKFTVNATIKVINNNKQCPQALDARLISQSTQ